MGDAVLVAVAEALRSCVRETDKVGRFGGEEFLVLLAETTPGAVLDVAERCLNGVRAIPVNEIIPGAEVRQTVSIGAAWYPDHGATLDELTARADEAMYHAKGLGRDRVVLYGSELAVPVERAGIWQLTAHRLLWVGASEQAALKVLERRFAVVKAQSADEAEALCERNVFEIVVAAPEQAAAGVELLRRVTRVSPSSLRVLLLGPAESAAQLARSQSVIHVDLVLSANAQGGQLLAELENGLLRRELLKGRLLTASGPWPEVGVQEILALEAILEGEKLDMAYQPIVEASRRRVIGYEALCRPPRCFSGPELLIETAFQSGLLWELGRLIRRQVVAALERLPSDQQLFINLHPAEVSDEKLLEGEPLLRPFVSQVVFEITERAAIRDPEPFQRDVAALRKNGYRLAIDDLGSGYASLNSVALLEPDFVKIDQFLIRGIDSSGSRQALLRSIVAACNSQHIKVIAEGIETAAELETTVRLGCHYLQGYALGRPAGIVTAGGKEGGKPTS
jgi:EAL domain-containing protein (putative c-di-GMP-specific phosphodiesterase class I)